MSDDDCEKIRARRARGRLRGVRGGVPAGDDGARGAVRGRVRLRGDCNRETTHDE
jgi:hypothetical protein